MIRIMCTNINGPCEQQYPSVCMDCPDRCVDYVPNEFKVDEPKDIKCVLCSLYTDCDVCPLYNKYECTLDKAIEKAEKVYSY